MNSSPSGPPITVVLIDDSADLLFLVRGAHERGERFRVVAEAADGEQGVVAVGTAQP